MLWAITNFTSERRFEKFSDSQDLMVINGIIVTLFKKPQFKVVKLNAIIASYSCHKGSL